MGDLPGHEFRGNQYTTGGGAVGRLQEIAAKHGVRYDEASGKFKVGYGPNIEHLSRENKIPANAAAIEHTPVAENKEREIQKIIYDDRRTREDAEKVYATRGTPWPRTPDSESHPRVPAGPGIRDAAPVDRGRPEAGKVYALTGGTGGKSIAQGHTWAESEVKKFDPNARLDSLGRPLDRKSELRKVSGETSRAPRTKGQKAYARRKAKDQMMSDMGLTKVKGLVSGKTYWE